MDIRNLRYFVAVAQSLNITKAADQLYLSRQALSKAIHELETECGFALFLRDNSRIQLTPAGRDLLEKTVPLVSQFDELQQTIDHHAPRKPGKIRIAIGLGTMNTLSPRVFEEFRGRFPEITLTTQEFCDDEVRKVLNADEADLGILTTTPERIADYNFRLVQPGKFCMQLSVSHPLATKERLTWADLHNQPLVSLGDRCDMHCVLMAKCREVGSFPRIVLETIDSNVANQMVVSDTAISLASNFAESIPLIRILPVDSADLTWGTYAIYQKSGHPSPSTRLLLDTLGKISAG